ncbi:hypothetical protein [Garciella nitratireducens]|uniref:Uncharacterized protein n=1 Tax=Garciella nitratireducens DSM 15102 TaxID=1121911 RepID=A0A1T4PJR0_9FIRM|nr:hypothetical protein [Garciella nitratireducens]SJZ91466.1 hypothetical protein SAMN02745973_02110 [Garciella nitratireducens DSM 15102]
MKKYFLIIGIILMIHFYFTGNVQAEQVLYDTYKGELKIEIRSYTPNWRGEKLKQVYEELLNNAYGEEIKYLSTINLYPDNPYGGEEEGLYHGAYQKKSFLNYSNYTMQKNRTIDLFNMKEKNDIQDIARTLSHEYGHHFTLYYLMQYEGKTFEQWRDTDYAKIRGLTQDKRVRNDYSNGHQWNITEIAAEDYVQLFGSLTAKKPTYYDDIVERAEKQTLDKKLNWNNRIYNIYPQENMNIPLANNIFHLREYWEKATKLKVNSGNQPPESVIVGLTEVRDLGYNKKQYVLQWTKSLDQDSSELLYTVVAFDDKQQELIPIKTVRESQELKAVLGSIKIIQKDKIVFYSDTFVDSPKTIFIFIMDEQGNIVSSNGVKIDFNQPTIVDYDELINQKKIFLQEKSENALDFMNTEKEKKSKKILIKILNFTRDLLEKID